MLTVYCYFLFLTLSKHNVFLKLAQCFKLGKQFLVFGKLGRNIHGEIDVEDLQALLNHGKADYNSCG